MKNLTEFMLLEAEDNSEVYVVYFEDGTMYNYFENSEDANNCKELLNKECPANNCIVKKEKRTEFIDPKA